MKYWRQLEESIAEAERIGKLIADTQPVWSGHLLRLVQAFRDGYAGDEPQPEAGTSWRDVVRCLVNQWREFGPEHFDETLEAAAKRLDDSQPEEAETKPETQGSWEQRCAVLYQVLGSLAHYSGAFGHPDIDAALDVAVGRGDVENLLPWPKDEDFLARLAGAPNCKPLPSSGPQPQRDAVHK